jgi:predicted AlkP superfamily phosphohydrolase/phosphomutase
MVSGAGGGSKPKLKEGVYPYDLRVKYANDFADYRFDVRKAGYVDKDPRCMVDDLITMTQARGNLASTLLKRESWDLSFVVFVGIDRLLHWMWDALPVIGDSPSAPLTDMIASYFKELDTAIERLLCAAPDADVLLISDHGFQNIEKSFYINDWLLEQGFQTRKSGNLGLITAGRKIVKRLLNKRRGSKLPGLSSDLTYLPELNWGRTLSYGDRAPGIFLNPRLDEDEKTRLAGDILVRLNSELCAELREVLVGARSREELYGVCARLDLAPEIMLDLAPGVQVLSLPRNRKMFHHNVVGRMPCKNWRKTATTMQGMHSSNALFAAFGTSAEECYGGETELIDFCTIVRRYFSL